MDAIYQLGKASVADVKRQLPDPPSYSAVRAMMGILEDKGLLCHQQEGLRYIYRPTVARGTARQSAIQHLIRTFFNNSPERAVAALLDMSDMKLSPRDAKRLARLIENAKQEKRQP